MKYLLMILILLSNIMYGQQEKTPNDRLVKDAIKSEIINLAKENIYDLMVIHSNNQDGLILWKSLNDKIFGLRICVDKKAKSKKFRLSTDDKNNFESILKNPKSIDLINNKNCNEKVHAFNIISISLKSKNYDKKKFIQSNCFNINDNRELKFIWELYERTIRN